MIPFAADVIDRYRAEGWWDGLTLHELFVRNAERTPEAFAVLDAPNRAEFCLGEPARWTYTDVRERADRLAAALLAEGVARDDVVMVQLPNVAELVLVYLAAARIGAIVSPLPVQYRAHELRLTGSLAEPVVFITTTNVAGFDHVELLGSVRAESRRCAASWPCRPSPERARAGSPGSSSRPRTRAGWTPTPRGRAPRTSSRSAGRRGPRPSRRACRGPTTCGPRSRTRPPTRPSSVTATCCSPRSRW